MKILDLRWALNPMTDVIVKEREFRENEKQMEMPREGGDRD